MVMWGIMFVQPFLLCWMLFQAWRVTATTESSEEGKRDALPPSLAQNEKRRTAKSSSSSSSSSSFDEWTSHWTTTSLDYGDNHPFERYQQQQRRFSQTLSYTNNNSSSSPASYQPIRITFIADLVSQQPGGTTTTTTTTNSQSSNSRIQYILSTILPQVQSIWSSYLKVIPVVGSLPLDNTVCDGAVANQLPASLLKSGIPNTDLAIIVTFADSLPTTSGGSSAVVDICQRDTLAAARFCSVDQFDRPYLGLINFCPQNATSNATSSQQQPPPLYLDATDEIRLVTHELGHVLGMNYLLFPYFRDPTTGLPRTPRPIPNQTVECTGDLSGTSQIIPFASTNTIQQSIDDKGLLYYEIVTPRVQAVVRNHFNCPTLNGARLESQDTSATACIGSHWDQRWFVGELMGAIFFPNTSIVLSPVTLALMEDSGWYHVDYTNVSLLGFGQGAGCDFVNSDCIANDVVPAYGTGFWCNTPTPVLPDGAFSYNGTNFYCDPTHQIWTACDLFDLQQVPTVFKDAYIPKNGIPIHYFSNPNLVSLLPQTNYCPLPRLSLEVACADSSTQVVTTFQNEQYGSSSRCINAYFFDTSVGKQRNFPGCFQIKCDHVAFQVVVNGHACSYDFEPISIQTLNFASATLICPRLAAVCPDLFCPGDCSGRGTCNYSKHPPICECFDSSDTSSNCNATTTASTPSPVTSPPYTRLPTMPSLSNPTIKPSSVLPNKTSSTSGSSRKEHTFVTLMMLIVASMRAMGHGFV